MAKAPEKKSTGKAAGKGADKGAAKGAAKSAAKGSAKGAAKGGSGKPNALQQPLQPSPQLAAVVGTSPIPRGEVVSKIWEYIKKNNLQNPENKREILADDKLEPIFGRKKVTMFEMNKYLAQHLK